MTGQAICAILSVALSVALETVPGLREKWTGWQYKRLAWLFGCLAVPLAWVGLAYAGAPVGYVVVGPFVWDGLFAALSAAFAAYFASQTTYAIIKP